jgi:hypothetical protein
LDGIFLYGVCDQTSSRAGYQRQAPITLAAKIEKFVTLFSPGTRQMHMNKEAEKIFGPEKM